MLLEYGIAKDYEYSLDYEVPKNEKKYVFKIINSSLSHLNKI